MAIEEYNEFEPATIDDYSQPFEDTLAIDYTQSDSFINPREFINPGEIIKPAAAVSAMSALGYGIAKYGKRAIARGIDTYGFGANVTGSYQGDSKVAQFTNNLLTAADGKRRNIPLTFLKSMVKSGNPIELNAMKSSLIAVENYMSKLKSQGRQVPKKVTEYFLNLQKMEPERRMAHAIVQKSFKQPINFKHSGKFIYNSLPQADPDINKALINKGANVNKPITVFNVSDDKFMVRKLRQAATGDPRAAYITKLLKENKIKEAKTVAKKGKIMLKGKPVKMGVPIELVKEGNNWVLKFVPHRFQKGKLVPVKEYVVGGHTQKTVFSERLGSKKGFHRLKTDMFDITTYRSAGETVKGSKGVSQKARVLFAGPVGEKLGIHQPVVTTASYKHNAPGGGRPVNAPDIVKRKGRKFVEAWTSFYNLLKKNKGAKLAASIATGIITKGRRF